MNALLAYLPEDRARALARGVGLPNRTHGAALFADISGFTPLTEALTQTLGPRVGAEVLTNQINAVYMALTSAVGRWRGSVIGFAGDAITCWFDDQAAGAPAQESAASWRAAACALAMQTAMEDFAALTLPGGHTIGLRLKVSIATGPARRFIVGDPSVQLIDVLAGATVARMAAGEHLAGPGDVLVDDASVAALGLTASLGESRVNPLGGERFSLLRALTDLPLATPWEPVELPAESLRPWLLPMIYARHQAGLGVFLTELRPAVVLFLRFAGDDYDYDGATYDGVALNALICSVQAALSRTGGTLLQIIIGDKGSYCYAVFGAPVAYEDDTRRAARTALALHATAAEIGLPPLQIGISEGTLRSGDYGGGTRRTYGVLGDDVNLAARLMAKAAPGETLISGWLQAALGPTFACEPCPPMVLKGKAEPMSVFKLLGLARRRAVRLQEPGYTLPMMGRVAELGQIAALLEQTTQGQGQVVALVGEAGMGKSRLAAEVVRLAQRRNLTCYGGAAQSSGVRTPYLAWRSIFQALLDVDPDAPLHSQLCSLEDELAVRAPTRRESLPLLGLLLELPLPENEFTRALEEKDRKGALEALLLDLLTQAAREAGTQGGALVLVLEDLHWLDPLGHDLLVMLAHAAAPLPLFILLAYRPLERARAQSQQQIATLPYYTTFTLEALDEASLEGLVQAKLAQLFPTHAGELPPELTRQLATRAQGNPFYIEEILSYMRDRGLDPYDSSQLKTHELPGSLHRLILARIDQLSEWEQTTLRVASVVGRLFYAAWLPAAAPELGALPRVKEDLSRLSYLELTPQDTPEPELGYLFKHIITQEVAYESLPQGTRQMLHEQLGHWLEAEVAALPPLDLLAYHYGHSANVAKQREYFQRAGDAAKESYANEAAIDYYERLLPLLEDAQTLTQILLRLGQVLAMVGRPDEAVARANEAITQATAAQQPRLQAQAQLLLADLANVRGDYAAALAWQGQAQAICETIGDLGTASRTLRNKGMTLTLLGDYAAARVALDQALAVARAAGHAEAEADAIHGLGYLESEQSEDDLVGELLEEALSRWRTLGNRRKAAITTQNLAWYAVCRREYALAQQRYEDALVIARQIGFQGLIGTCLANLGRLAGQQGDYARAEAFQAEGLRIARAEGNRAGTAGALQSQAEVAMAQGQHQRAAALLHEALEIRRSLGNAELTLHVLHVGALVAASAGQIEATAQLAGALAAIHLQLGIELDPEEVSADEATAALVRDGLTEEVLASARGRGATLDLDAAVVFALELLVAIQ